MNNKLKTMIESVVDNIKEQYQSNFAVRVFPIDETGSQIKGKTDNHGEPVLEYYISRDETQKVVKVLYKLNENYPGTNTSYLIVKTVTTKDWDNKNNQFSSTIYLSDAAGTYSEPLSENFLQDPDEVIRGLGYELSSEKEEVLETLERFFTVERVKKLKLYPLLREKVEKDIKMEKFTDRLRDFSNIFLQKTDSQSGMTTLVSNDIFFLKSESFSDSFKKNAAKITISFFKKDIEVISLAELRFGSQKIDGKLVPKAYFVWKLNNPYDYMTDFGKFEVNFDEIKAFLYQIALEFSFK